MIVKRSSGSFALFHSVAAATFPVKTEPTAEVEDPGVAVQGAPVALVALEERGLGGGNLDAPAHRRIELLRGEMGLGKRPLADGDIARKEGDPQFRRQFAAHRARGVRHDVQRLPGRPPAEGVDLGVEVIDGPPENLPQGRKIAPGLFPVRGMEVDLEIPPVPKDDDALPEAGKPLGGILLIPVDL